MANTKQALLREADRIEKLEEGEEGSYAEYLHQKARNLRWMAVDAEEEE